MDFYGILFDIKNGKKMPYSKNYFDTLFAAKLEELGVKTITDTLPIEFTSKDGAIHWTIYGKAPHDSTETGTLPLTFTAKAGAASDWTIYGNDDNGTENIFNINDMWITAGQTTYSVNGQTLTVTGNWYVYTIIPVERNTNYYLSFNTVSSTTLQAVSVFGVLNGELNNTDVIVNMQKVPFILTTGEREQIAVVFYSGFNTVGTSVYDNIMLVKGSTAPDHYIPYQQGVGERTKNICTSPTAQTKTDGALSVTTDGQGRYNISISSTTSTQTEVSFDLPEFTIPVSVGQGGNGTFSMFNTVKSGVYIVFYYNGTQIEYWVFNPANRQTNNYISMGNKQCNRIAFRISGTAYEGTAECAIMFTNDSILPTSYAPYGYQIPLTVSQTGQTDKTVDIYIGDSPLTDGETVSKQSTGIDIELFEGENTVSTTLYNKPETSITYTDYLGVGEFVNGQWQIPLTVTCDRNLLNIYGNMAHSGGVHTIDFNVETSSVTGEMPANSFYQLGIQNAIVKGDETFVISFDKTTAGTAELQIVKGEGSGAEIIETIDISEIKSYQVVFECEESFGNVYPRLVATEAATQTFEHLMIKKASDKGGFVPYGAHTDYTIPIDAPLTEGQSVSDTVEITAYEGENTLDTTLTVKPDATIKFK